MGRTVIPLAQKALKVELVEALLNQALAGAKMSTKILGCDPITISQGEDVLSDSLEELVELPPAKGGLDLVVLVPAMAAVSALHAQGLHQKARGLETGPLRCVSWGTRPERHNPSRDLPWHHSPAHPYTASSR
jgi:hypothetical protein